MQCTGSACMLFDLCVFKGSFTLANFAAKTHVTAVAVALASLGNTIQLEPILYVSHQLRQVQWRHVSQHNGIEHNDTHHNNIEH
jgi:hypothetical protein